MSALYDTDNPRTGDRAPPAGAPVGRIDEAGVYLTDEVFLYRIVGFATSGVREMVELEDCYRLDVVSVPVTDLRARGLRVVVPTPVEC